LCSVQDIFNMRRQIHISNVSILLRSLFCNVHVSLPCNAILHTNALTMLFSAGGWGIHTWDLFFVESFLCQCNATSYFTFASAVLGHHTSNLAELCDWPHYSLPLTIILNFLPFLSGIRITLAFFTFIRMLYLSDVCWRASICVEFHAGCESLVVCKTNGLYQPTSNFDHCLSLIYLQALRLWHAGCRFLTVLEIVDNLVVLRVQSHNNLMD